MDAAIIPGALGVNPFATITAIAERNVDEYTKAHNLTIDQKANVDKNNNHALDLFGEPQNAPTAQELEPDDVEEIQEDRAISDMSAMIRNAKDIDAGGFGFTEVMSGYIHKGDGMMGDKKETYEIAYRMGKSLCESARFFLSIQSYNMSALVKQDSHEAALSGTFVCPTIPGSPFMVRGKFGLFTLYAHAPGTRNMTYDFEMQGVDGKTLHFYGYKVIDSSVALAPFQFWKSSSTLYVTITDRNPDPDDTDSIDATAQPGNDKERREVVIAKGIMHINPMDFASQIFTMAPTGSSLMKRAWSTISFMKYFTKSSLSLFMAPFTPLQYPSVTYTGYTNDTNPDGSYVIYADDVDDKGRQIKTRMHMWQSTNNAIETKNLFMIPGAAVDHQIYALPTIPYNAVNYFTRAGYRVFIAVHRIGQLMVAQNNWTTYDARHDIKACLKYIRENFPDEDSPGNKVYTIAHCMGSVAFSAGLLEGTIPSSWVLGITCSQVFMNPVWGTVNKGKILLGLPTIPLDRLYKMLGGTWFSCSTAKDDSLLQRAVNEILRFYPDERKEICNNASCHRCSLVFGRCWNHRNLNEATHRQIDRFFGGVNMSLLHLLMKQGWDGYVQTNDFKQLTTEDNIERLRGIPMLLFSGRDNAVLSVEATERTYSILCDVFGSRDSNGGIQYRRRVVPGYGHLDGWMGRNAWKDVYPFVREEVDRVVRGEEYVFKEPDDRFKEMVDSGELLY
jgi:hypothetical protein